MEILSRNTKKVGNKYYISNREKYYKNGDSFFESDINFKNSESNIGDIYIVDKNVFSFGVRKDNNSNKLFGLRPDDNQDGSRQIEFSVNNINYNGDNYDLSLEEAIVNKNEIDLGQIKFSNQSGIFKQLYKAVDVNDFVITLDLDLTGYSIKNNKYTEEKIIKDTVTCNVQNIGENTAENTLKYISNNDISNTDSKKLSFLIGKITDDSILTGNRNQSDEFGDSDLSGYNIMSMPPSNNQESINGSSMYMKDTIAVYCKAQNIDTNYFEDILLNNICEKYNVTTFDEVSNDEDRAYFLYDNKKIGGYYIINDNEFLMYFNTKVIPDDVKDLFKLKNFNQTSYLDLELDNVVEDFQNQFTYKMEKITLDSNAYMQDNGCFTIQDSDNRCIHLNNPYVIDSEGNIVDVLCGHSLEEVSLNKYRYKKFIYPECSMLLRMKGTCYIDPTISLDSKRFDNDESNSTWSASRNSSSYGLSHTQGHLCRSQRSTSLGSKGSPGTTSYKVLRSSYRWDTSAVSGQVSGTLTGYFRGNGSNLYAVKDLRAQTSVYIFKDFSAWVADGSWDEEDYTTGSYTDELYINNQAGPDNDPDTTGVTHSFTLTDAAITQINDNSVIDMFFMSKNDMENIALTSTTNNYIGRGRASSDWYDGAMDLVLSADEDDVTYNANFFGANF